MVVLLQGVSRQLFKTKLHKKVDMSKVNDKSPNCFQPVQLFFSMPSCLPSFVSHGLIGEDRRESQQWWNLPPLPPTAGLIHAEKPRSSRVKPTQFQGQIGPLFGIDLKYFMEIYRIAILTSQCSAFFLEEACMYKCVCCYFCLH